MIYVMSDIHGEYDKYIEMLSRINFSDSDILYVLGDVVDRGSSPMKLLNDMSMRPNVYPLIGNHDIMAYDLLKKLSVEITLDNYETYLDGTDLTSILEWQLDGGNSTIDDFRRLSEDDREYVLEYLEEFALYDTVKVNGNTYILVHAGLGNFDKSKALQDYSLEELAFIRFDYDKKYFDDDSVFIITGHTPTLEISGLASIYKNNNNICVDCGATFEGGRLGCLCLDTMEEYYV